jgi:hypothetical protein
MKRTLLAGLFGAALLSVTPLAHADKAAAEALFNAGIQLMQSGKAGEACPKFEQSQREEPHPATLLNLGKCYESVGKTASAWSAYKDAATLARQMQKPEHEASGKQLAAALEPKLSKLKVDGTPVPGLVLKRDGVEISVATLGIPVAVDPGEHVIEVAAQGYEPTTLKVTVGKNGDVQSVSIPPLQKAKQTVVPPGGAAAPAAGDDGSSQRTIGYIVGGVGVASLGFGAVMGLMAASDKSAAEDDVTLCPDQKCTPAGREKIDSAESKALLSTIGFGVGAAAIAGGVVLILTAGGLEHEKAPEPGPTARVLPTFDPNGGGLTVVGRF